MKRSREGFIFYEMVIYLLITAICFSVIYNELFLTKKVMNHGVVEQVNWHSSTMELDRLFENTKVSNATDSSISFSKTLDSGEKTKTYTLERYQKMLRVRGASQGHMPILLDVHFARFNYKDGLLKIKITRRNKKIYEYVHKFEE
ncbi:ComGF family competence protein [Lactobacillus sp. YT155]|uniref:ComGF family competence protein n=1 Tax=Lactobacillus sp. YT155 TaxID=3060955 RepID=UPI00265FD409|nr:ComGF family competence protein [Lactobacillus sp. YT155]MDO1605050.1 ComGF family competence protein [Lactobacillus sp. YT155]